MRHNLENKPGPGAVIHWLRADEKGPIVSGGLSDFGLEGGQRRLQIACKPGRPTVKNLDVTDHPSLVTCERCRSRKVFLSLTPEQRGETPQLVAEKADARALAELAAHQAAAAKAAKGG